MTTELIKEPTHDPRLPDCEILICDTLEEWLAQREPVIGASEAASIFGVGYADESPMIVWARKTGQLESREDNELMESGRVLQPAIIELFRSRYTREHPERATNFQASSLNEFSLCRSIEHPWLGASLDDFFTEDATTVLVEAKNVSIFMGGDWHDEEPPLKFHIQAQQQIAVTGADRCFVVGLIGGNKLKWAEAHRDQKFIDAMLPRLAEFHDLVITRTEPSGKWIDGTEATKKALGKIHPKDTGEVVILPQESYLWHTQLQELKDGIKQAEVEKTRLENLLRSEIGDASTGLLPSGEKYNWRWQSRAEHFVKASEFRVLRYSKK